MTIVSKVISAFALTALLALSAESSFAQGKKTTKAKSKVTTSKTVKTKGKVSPETENKVETETTTTETAIEPSAPVPATTEFSTPSEAVPPTTPAPAANADTSMSGGSHLFGLEAAVGLPHPLRLGLVYVHPSQMFSAEANYGSFSLDTEGVKAKMTNMEIGLRWHPFSGAFHVGALVGNRTISLDKTEIISGQSIVMNAEIKSAYVAPNIGWMWGANDGGFIAGMDFGVVSPSGVTSTFSSNADAPTQATPDYQKLDADVRDAGKKLGETTLPMWTLFKIGYLF